ncbi:transcriptional activator DEMETER-like isoform X1 [Cucurbita pepo subsp. pepo]|uniref:transcriptional activator DEMETER-like isoform X1 n=1 Tax=Cucurbita pepo subsp. pepo TaxID=3664 RepID=UPI000C9D779D|nr:transcriptional activator DEMETER-like isoform X1 [Cucurbita pepo subsp. pepo]XP_023518047.1 transcriptional activator DEMETER-like isoform X1 [Cucurbita pepo subsp. pepo]
MNSQYNSSGDFYAGNLLLRNQNLYSGSRPSSNDSYAQHVRTYGLPMYQPNHNNPVSMTQGNQMSIFMNSAHTPPVSSHLENFAYDHIATSSFLVRDESSSFRKDGEDDFIRMFQAEAPRQPCDELLQSIVESSCVGNSTPFKGTKDFGKQRDLEIDLNKTPEQRPPKRRQHTPMVFSGESFTDLLNLPLDENLSLYEETQENFVTVPLDEATQKRHDELLKDLTDTLSAGISEPTNEAEKGSDQVIDHKTTEQKTPKRRKHRPKVIKEGKPKKSPKPVTPKISKETPSGKRKYVRRKNIKEAVTPPENIMEIKDSNPEAKTKSCRRVINFEMEKTGDEEQEKERNEKDMQENMGNSCFITRSNVPGFSTQSNGICGTSPDVQDNHRLGTLVAESVQPSIQSYIARMNHMMTSHISQSEREAAESPLNSSGYNKAESLFNVLRILDQGKGYQYQTGFSNGYTPVEQNIRAEEMEKFATTAKRNTYYKEMMGMNSAYSQTVPNHQSNINEARGSKRGCPLTAQPTQLCSITSLDSSVLCQEALQTGEFHRLGSSTNVGSLEIPGKKFESGLYSTLHNRYSTIQPNEDCSRHLNTTGCSPTISVGFTAEMKQAMLNGYHIRSNQITDRQSSWTKEIIGDGHIHSVVHGNNFQRRQVSHNLHPEINRMCETSGLNTVNSHRSLIIRDKCNMLQPFPHPKAPEQWYACRQPNNSILTVRQACQPMISGSLATNVQKQGYSFGMQQFSAKTTSLLEYEITRKLKSLSLKDDEGATRTEQNAIVPYNGNGAVVPYVESEYLRKRKARPRVDLDPETERIWNLLMGKEGIEGIENHEKDKEKWWEEERKVFRGRADSFIARMHLVQGDRRFSRWKGSVVDSVIGVFLTQNVSDHLSSSAFMSLAARFPVKSTSNFRTPDEVETSIVANELATCLQYPADSIRWDGQELSVPSFEMPQTSIIHQNHRVNSGTENFFTERGGQIVEEEVISSQGSFDSTITQGTAGARSCSGSNSEAEEPIVSNNSNSTHYSNFTDIKQTETTTVIEKPFSDKNRTSVFDEVSEHKHWQLPDGKQDSLTSEWNEIDNLSGHSLFNFLVNIENQQKKLPDAPSNNQLRMTSDCGVLEVEGREAFSEESISSGPSIISGCSTEKNTTCHSLNTEDPDRSSDKISAEENRPARTQETTRMEHSESVSEHSVHRQGNGIQLTSRCEYSLHDNYKPCERNNTSPLESASVSNPPPELDTPAKKSALSNVVHVHAHTEKLLPGKGNLINFSNNEAHSLSQADNEGNISPSKAKRRKVNSEKNSAIDWDSLRKQVEANGQIKEKGKDAMDSIDYEAIRLANVQEISSAIKERGMNNMLAERIKEFLNRLVTDHGSIDLEWLRDVPPDQAKDYLLSVRGLGLKSVECVRLLTLHHLAFPVDTNVGRIAVRLGWVPLQPLPESLQLHLLELYPVLETIQKYLWPRLCKLDQRTLYELHYQLITFGKVFCTKSKPNCNACPMRGECKHFASAFASARLALPAPDEKGIVASTNPISTEKQPPIVTSHLPILPPESTYTENTLETSKCEPIVEVPATPEPEPNEMTESDIEDLFYEDPDEIPTIKLSMEEFKTTLQNYIPEGDMSRALVALNPEAAYIPTPKLKNVSRLRTEHQVYELPDSHPLLREMDRREPDDPSPYLLAIWTPGETADSIQPPEQSCGSQDPDRLCNEKTCFTCNSRREANSQTVRGTLLVPCRTAMRGSFPLNGTYFQVNEMFADHESSMKPIDVPRTWLWNLPRRTVYFGTSVSSIFKGLVTEEIQQCFWRGFVCVRGFDQKTRAPRPLIARLHFPASKLAKVKNGHRE